jgi:type IV secretion system protein VirB10
MWVRALVVTGLCALVLAAQDAAPAPAPPTDGFRKVDAPASGDYTVDTGSKIALSLINSVSTKHSVEGDRVYLETVFPVLVSGKIVVPVGSYVAGTVTQIKKPGRVKGRGELYVRFDSLTLPNGVTRDFRARMDGLDGNANSEVDRKEGRVSAPGNKKGDLQTIGEAASSGAAAGGLIGGLGAGHPGLGVGIGAAAGATVGMIGVLLSRGPDAVLEKGATVEMVLDRPIRFNDAELNFGGYQPPRSVYVNPPVPSSSGASVPNPRGRFPF